MQNLTIVTKTFAPYRFELYEEVRRYWNKRDVNLVIQHRQPTDHAWTVDPQTIFQGSLQFAGSGSAGLIQLWKLLTRSDPQLLWVAEYSPFSTVAFVWALWHKRPIIISSEVGDRAPKYARKIYSGPWQRFWRRFAKGVIANTEDARETAIAEGIPVFLAPHAVRQAIYEPVKVLSLEETSEKGKISSKPVILYVGQMNERKGVRDLLKACDTLARQGLDFQLCCVGGGHLLNELREAYSSRPWVCFSGFLEADELTKSYLCADVFVLPTYADTYAAVVHEAALAGLALIVSRTAGASELLVQGKGSGLVFDAGDVDELVECLARLIEDVDFREKCSACARAIGLKYCIEKLGPECSNWLKSHL